MYEGLTDGRTREVAYDERMFYYLPNGRAIDGEGAVDALLDEVEGNRYFLDMTTGEVGCVEGKGKGAREKLATLQDERCGIASCHASRMRNDWSGSRIL